MVFQLAQRKVSTSKIDSLLADQVSTIELNIQNSFNHVYTDFLKLANSSTVHPRIQQTETHRRSESTLSRLCGTSFVESEREEGRTLLSGDVWMERYDSVGKVSLILPSEDLG